MLLINEKTNLVSRKLGLTMRQKFLGKEEWIEEDIEETYAEKEGKPVESSEEEET